MFYLFCSECFTHNFLKIRFHADFKNLSFAMAKLKLKHSNSGFHAALQVYQFFA